MRLLVGMLLGGILSVAGTAGAQVYLPASKDATVQRAHRHQGNGSWGRHSLKFGGGAKHSLMAFAIPDGVEPGPDDVAMIRLRMDPRFKRFGKFGAWMVANLMACDGVPDWIEGIWRRERFYCLKRCKAGKTGKTQILCPAETEASVTWSCPVDPDVQDTRNNCPVEEQWNGGSDWIRRSPDFPDDVHRDAPIDPDAPAIHVVGNGEVVWLDVTEHVRRALACGDREPTWLLRSATKRGKRIKFFSREALPELCLCGETDLCNEVGGPVTPALYIGPP